MADRFLFATDFTVFSPRRKRRDTKFFLDADLRKVTLFLAGHRLTPLFCRQETGAAPLG
jgi:hypothetical protein